jgi:RNA polymerase sigma-70 factor (ECF subfamily)
MELSCSWIPVPMCPLGLSAARVAAILRVRVEAKRQAAAEAREGHETEVESDEQRAERQLCLAAQAGDRQALGAILRRYGPKLYRFVLLPRLGSEAAAQDALADTYVRVVERFSSFEWRGRGVYPWLRVVASRIALDQLRKRKRETLFEPDDLQRAVDAAQRDEQEGIDEALCQARDRHATRSKLDDALGKINQRYARAIRLRILEEKSREEAATLLEVSVPTFDVVLHRALSALKKILRVARP